MFRRHFSIIRFFTIFSLSLVSFIVIEIPRNPCNPSPCGSNAICKERNGAGSCTCVKNYFGDPYAGCRPECLMNNDCPHDRACLAMKCRDPCPGSCGLNAECKVMNHNPQCYCRPGYTGNALNLCREIPASKISPKIVFFPVFTTPLIFSYLRRA